MTRKDEEVTIVLTLTELINLIGAVSWVRKRASPSSPFLKEVLEKLEEARKAHE